MAELRIANDLSTLDPAAWNALLEQSPQPTPFMRHEYLQALITSGCSTPETGWTPCILSVHQGRDELLGACAAYLKAHSYGEYVFDWAWADAYQRHGLDYYPKLLVAVPFTPVPGSRLLARDQATRGLLLRGLQALAERHGLSSAHLLFGDAQDQDGARAQGWMQRSGVQFHWHNREPAPYASFEEFLAALQRDKRKKIQQEQRRVREVGVSFQALEGAAITTADWDFFHRCYELTYRAHRSTPYLNREFFRAMQQRMAAHCLMFLAWRGKERVAASLIVLDPARGLAYGRYWGALEAIPCLHFDACYYQPLAWCIAQGYRRFEGGAQGEHKMARGLMPVATGSSHWLAHPGFSEAVADFLGREGQVMRGYMGELEEHRPFKSGPDKESAPRGAASLDDRA